MSFYKNIGDKGLKDREIRGLDTENPEIYSQSEHRWIPIPNGYWVDDKIWCSDIRQWLGIQAYVRWCSSHMRPLQVIEAPNSTYEESQISEEERKLIDEVVIEGININYINA